MKPVGLAENESVIIGAKFEYFAPGPYEEESGMNWRYPDSKVEEDDLPVLRSLAERHLVCHRMARDWNFIDKDCWTLTEHGLAIFNWFHSFPENCGV